jgi:hypothetical protein
MNRYVVPGFVVALLIAALAIFGGGFGKKYNSTRPGPFDEYIARDGAAEATRDLENKCAHYCVYGRLADTDFMKEWSESSFDRFGIKIDAIAGCIVSDDLVRFAKNYNRVLLNHIAKQYGETAWEDCRKDAEHRIQDALRKARQSSTP